MLNDNAIKLNIIEAIFLPSIIFFHARKMKILADHVKFETDKNKPIQPNNNIPQPGHPSLLPSKIKPLNGKLSK